MPTTPASSPTRLLDSAHQISARLKRLFTAPTTHIALLALGALLRTVQYAAGRSLWMDEAFLALNLRDHAFLDLLVSTEYEVAIPPGFLLLKHLVVSAFGAGEFALRLVPFVCGLASLPLFYHVARHILRPAATSLALFLFAITPSLIYYASELRPYGCDVVIALALTALGLWVHREGLTPFRAAVLAACGLVALPFSFPSIFVLAGVGVSLLLSLHRERRILGMLIGIGVVWVIGFVTLFATYITQHGQSEASFALWRFRFLQVPGFSSMSAYDALDRTATLLLDSLTEPLGFGLAGLAALLFLLGVLALRKRPVVASILVCPLLFTVAASFLHQYPFYNRLLLFLVPAALLTVATGASWLIERVSNTWFSLALLGLLVLPPAYQAIRHTLRPPIYYVGTEEARSLFIELGAQSQAGDAVYLHPMLEPHFRYYAPQLGLEGLNIRYLDLGPRDKWNRPLASNWQTFFDAVRPLQKHERAWLVLYPTHTSEIGVLNSLYTECLTSTGTLANRIAVPGMVAYLFHFPPEAADLALCSGPAVP